MKKAWGIINIELYSIQVLVSIGETKDALYKRLLKYGISKKEAKPFVYENDYVGRFQMFSGGQCIITADTSKLRTRAHLYGILAHECFHCTQAIMEEIGMPLRMDINDEAYAYLMGHLMEKCYEIS